MPFVKPFTAFVRETAAANGRKKQQLLWGDRVEVRKRHANGWAEVTGRNEKGWMRQDDLQEERLLEISFVDVGQGDGTFIVTPDDKYLLIDAGEGDNMFRFLRWRFAHKKEATRTTHIDHGFITHPDQDHYKGFVPLFADPQFTFGTMHHNGLVERKGGGLALLGPSVKENGITYLTDVVRSRSALKTLVNSAAVDGKQYPAMLKDALAGGRVNDFRSISRADGHVPGYDQGDFRIEVVGPVPESKSGRQRLRALGNAGETKNGHSIVLRLCYRDVRLLLGGDLNSAAENHLLRQHTGMDPDTADPQERAELRNKARAVFRSEVAKACHHGSADFTSLFLECIDAMATVVSSGDDEPHCHPRPDTLGALGRTGRGERPLIFSTELARSTKDTIRQPQALRSAIKQLYDEKAAAATPAQREAIQKKIDAKLGLIDRSVAVYGMITLRTDGRSVLLAQKLERPGTGGKEFDHHVLAPMNGVLRYRPEL